MPRSHHTALLAALLTGLSCGSSGSATQPGNTPAPGAGRGTGAAAAPAAPAPVAPTAVAPAGAPSGGAGPAGGRAPMTAEQRTARRDSLTAMRNGVIQQELRRIAGKETQSAQDVYQNLTELQDSSAAALLATMNEYGRALSVGCNHCHVPNKWEDDSKEDKQTARAMIRMVKAINADQLAKLPPNPRGQTPRISCITCHRGNARPGNQLMP